MEIRIKRRFNEKDLPDMKTLVGEARKIAAGITVGETLFMKKYGVRSEGEYKRKMAEAGHIMKHTHIGWNSWEATEKGFRQVYEGLQEAGSYIDRFGVCLDWVMGVPEKYRGQFQAGSGLIFKTPEEWKKMGQIVPVQPHLGDHMIGSLNSVENTVNGLSAGVTTIGNLSHYYTYEYPGLDMELERTADYVKAISIMAYFNQQGMIIHSNLDDGFGAQFHDLANLVGWARLERYVAEDLLDARVSHCFGNLFSDSMFRMIFNIAMGKINRYHTPGSFVNGNTIDYSTDIPRNFGALSAYSLADIIGQLKYPSGHAIAPVPLTEAIRVPSAEEILEAHHTVDLMIEKAPYYERFINWEKVEGEANVLVTGGKVFFERVLNGLDDLGVDITHAGQVVSVLKAIGPAQLEEAFGVGERDKNAMRGRIPLRPTSIIQTISRTQETLTASQENLDSQPLADTNVVICSTDVHEFGKEVIKNILRKAGANVYDLGTTVPVSEITDTVVETESKIVIVSTYNGMAYSFGRDLLAKLKEEHLDDVRVIMGGRLNEPMDGSDLPVDVTERLREMGINADNDAEHMIDLILSYKKDSN